MGAGGARLTRLPQLPKGIDVACGEQEAAGGYRLGRGHLGGLRPRQQRLARLERGLVKLVWASPRRVFEDATGRDQGTI